MSYRKFRADNIFTGYKLLDKDQVLITDEEGKIIEITSTKEAGDNIETYSGILSPGFINAHCHLELSHLKGIIPELTGLVDFILKVITDRHIAEEAIFAGIEKAEEQMLINGIVGVGDICNNLLTIPQKSKRRMIYHNFIELTGFSPAVMLERFDRSAAFLKNYIKSLPAQRSTLSPHAPYSASYGLFQLINQHTKGQLITMHNQETAEENILFINGTGDFVRLYKEMKIDISFFKPSGKSSLQTVLPYFDADQSIILVHNVHTSGEDIAFVMFQGLPVSWCLCPNANLYITNQLPDIDQLISNHCNIVLGTDSLASNYQLSILEEIKTIQRHFPHIELETLLQWATSNGAKALQMEGQLGSFEKGKTPGILLLKGKDVLNNISDCVVKRIV